MNKLDRSTMEKDLPPTPGILPPSTPIKNSKSSLMYHKNRTRSTPLNEALDESASTGRKEEDRTYESGKKSQLNAASDSFKPKPVDHSYTSTPDISKLSLGKTSTSDVEVSQFEDFNEAPTTPKKKKETSNFDTPRRHTHRQEQSLITDAAPLTPITPSTANSAAGTAPVTPHAPEWSSKGIQGKLPKASGGLETTEETPESIGRYLMITGIPRSATEKEVCELIQTIAEFKAMVVKYMRPQGYVIVVFHDSREAFKVYHHLQGTSICFHSNGPLIELHCWKIERSTLEAMTGRGGSWDQIWSSSESVIKVEINGGHPVTLDVMHKTLSMIGSLQRLAPVGHEGRTFIAEYYDTRDSAQAIILLNGQRAHEALLHVAYLYPDSSTANRMQTPSTPASYTLGSAAYNQGSLPRGYSGDRFPRAESTASSDVFSWSYTTEGSSLSQLRTPTSSVFGRVKSENDVFGMPSPSSVHSSKRESAPPGTRYPTPSSRGRYSIHSSHKNYETPPQMLALGRRLGEPGTVQGLINRADIAARARQRQGLGGHWNLNDRKAIPEQNRVFPERILSGLDSRTTVMIKDVPNKLSRQELVDILEESVPGGYDFVYLRFDFKNCCNALYHFIEARVGKKWNLFSSEKVLQVSYADIQGKAALINKFKNSAVMGVIEPWRPQIFYSSGSMKGLPEPFPDSDNLAIRQRSATAQLSAFSDPSSSGYDYDGDYLYDYGSKSVDPSLGV
ncbi:hypothetical protein IAR55_000448 [Kwoniella newhampshirensis]|uniref:RRM domain-containing protein n=1 Tax=Kwoniella newhampshirensis TaxID=1651941 RepID=A0AAW0Z781_9TREE